MKSDYVLEETECPECNGEGYLERMTWLSYDGDQDWKRTTCEHCHGNKVSMEPIQCCICKDEILKTELGEYKGKPAHRDCVDEEYSYIHGR